MTNAQKWSNSCNFHISLSKGATIHKVIYWILKPPGLLDDDDKKLYNLWELCNPLDPITSMEIELNLAGARKNINIVTTHPSQSGKCITGQNPGKGQTWNICVGYSEWDTNQSLYPPNFCSVKSESTSSKSRVKVWSGRRQGGQQKFVHL